MAIHVCPLINQGCQARAFFKYHAFPDLAQGAHGEVASRLGRLSQRVTGREQAQVVAALLAGPLSVPASPPLGPP